MPSEQQYIQLPALNVYQNSGAPVITDGPTTLNHASSDIDLNRYVKITPADSFTVADFGLAELPDGKTLDDLEDWSCWLDCYASMAGALPTRDLRVLGPEYIANGYEGARQLVPGSEDTDGFQHWPLVTGDIPGWQVDEQAILNNFRSDPTTVAPVKPLARTTFFEGSFLWAQSAMPPGETSAGVGLSPTFYIVNYPFNQLPANLEIYLYSLQITIQYRFKDAAPPPGPVAEFTFASDASGRMVDFDGSLSQAGGFPITSYTWDFGDHYTVLPPVQPADGMLVEHMFYAFGPFPVTLTVTDSNGVSASVTHEVDLAGLRIDGDYVNDRYAFSGAS